MSDRQTNPSEFYYRINRPRTYEPYLTRLRYLFTNEYGIDKIPECSDSSEKKGCYIDLKNKRMEIGYGSCAVSSVANVVSEAFDFGTVNPCIMIRQNKVSIIVYIVFTKMLIQLMHFTPPHDNVYGYPDKNVTDAIADKCKLEGFNNDESCCFYKRVQLQCKTEPQVKFEVYPSLGVPLCHYPYKKNSDKNEEARSQQPFYFVKVTKVILVLLCFRELGV